MLLSMTLLRQRCLLVKTQVCFPRIFRSGFGFSPAAPLFCACAHASTCVCMCGGAAVVVVRGCRCRIEVTLRGLLPSFLRITFSLNSLFWLDWLAIEPLASPVSTPAGVGLQIHPQHMSCVCECRESKLRFSCLLQ